MEGSVKGMVTSISSMFSPEEAQHAVKRVQYSIADRHKELEHVREFITDNNNIINLVQRLPDELHHDIMVPFGKAAFFPGQLIHTNEFLVLLGEGYYAERTSKQTIEILKRRGKVLESQVESIKALVQDLSAEASFFDATASEAAEGLVEIREDYNEEEDLTESALKRDSSSSLKIENREVPAEDEFASIMSRLDELEKQELEAESEEGECEEDVSEGDESEEDESATKDEQYAQMMSRLEELETRELVSQGGKALDENKHLGESFDEDAHRKSLLNHSNKSNDSVAAKMFPKVKEKAQRMPTPEQEVSTRTSQAETDSFKAFTCSIVEHTHNLQTNDPKGQNSASSQAIDSQPSKPVSRFKMNRR